MAEGFVEQQGPNHIVRIRQDTNLDELFKVAMEGELIVEKVFETNRFRGLMSHPRSRNIGRNKQEFSKFAQSMSFCLSIRLCERTFV